MSATLMMSLANFIVGSLYEELYAVCCCYLYQHIFLLQSTGVNRVTKYLLDLHPDDLQNVDDFSPF